MPTRSELLSPACKGWNKKSESCPQLSVRPMSPDTDMPIIYKWLSEDYAANTALTDQQALLLRDAYSSLLASDAVQTFIGLVDDNPVCEIELYKVRQHAISLSYASRPGDHYLELLPVYTPREHISGLLTNSLQYFFSCAGVERIMAEVDVKNEWMNALLIKVGFHWFQKLGSPNKVSNLYFCTRRSSRLAGRY